MEYLDLCGTLQGTLKFYSVFGRYRPKTVKKLLILYTCANDKPKIWIEARWLKIIRIAWAYGIEFNFKIDFIQYISVYILYIFAKWSSKNLNWGKIEVKDKNEWLFRITWAYCIKLKFKNLKKS